MVTQMDVMRGEVPTPRSGADKCPHPQEVRIYGGDAGNREFCGTCHADLGD